MRGAVLLTENFSRNPVESLYSMENRLKVFPPAGLSEGGNFVVLFERFDFLSCFFPECCSSKSYACNYLSQGILDPSFESVLYEEAILTTSF